MFIVKKLGYVNSLSGIVLNSRRKKLNLLKKSKSMIITSVQKMNNWKLYNLEKLKIQTILFKPRVRSKIKL